MNVNNADKTLGGLQNRQAMPTNQQSNAVLQYMSHVADPIGRIVGWNKSTGGSIPAGSSLVWEMIRVATGQENTSHNLYFVDQGYFKLGLSNQERGRLLNDFWRSGNPTLQPANR